MRAIVNAIRIKTIIAAATGNDRLAMRRIQDDRGGGVTVGPEHFVTGQVEAAIPSVAVTSDGTVGVFYYTFDGFSQDNLPIFSAHLAQSSDQGVTFSYQTLLNFLSSAADNGNSRQRGLGDYMQIKAVDDCFYGAFTGNGVPLVDLLPTTTQSSSESAPLHHQGPLQRQGPARRQRRIQRRRTKEGNLYAYGNR